MKVFHTGKSSIKWAHKIINFINYVINHLYQNLSHFGDFLKQVSQNKAPISSVNNIRSSMAIIQKSLYDQNQNQFGSPNFNQTLPFHLTSIRIEPIWFSIASAPSFCCFSSAKTLHTVGRDQLGSLYGSMVKLYLVKAMGI